jgi:hypothetical protein
MPATQPELRLRITLRRPPAGVRFALQRGKAADAENVAPQTADGTSDLTFECAVRVDLSSADAPRFLGSYVQGTPAARFFYLTVGSSAGQVGSPWQRRVKVSLEGIDAPLVKAALADPGGALEATLEGTLADGSPICATRPFLGEGWHVRETTRPRR